MKFLFPILFLACTAQTGCTDDQPTVETSARMEGEPANVYAQGYNEMCEREPESKLCPQGE